MSQNKFRKKLAYFFFLFVCLFKIDSNYKSNSSESAVLSDRSQVAE